MISYMAISKTVYLFSLKFLERESSSLPVISPPCFICQSQIAFSKLITSFHESVLPSRPVLSSRMPCNEGKDLRPDYSIWWPPVT
jgi:hypothetical protein